MSTVNIIICDDEPKIHDYLRKTLDSISFDYKIIKDFYELDDLEDYLFGEMETENVPDILILDNIFYSSQEITGLSELPNIREASPNLPILMLSTMSDDQREFSDARKKFNIDYMQKPVRSSDLRFRIETIIQNMKDYDTLYKYIEQLTKDNTELNKNLDQALKSDIPNMLPIEMQTLIQTVFPDIEILPKAFRFLVHGCIKLSEWTKIFRCLKLIDWKQETCNINGITMNRFIQGIKMGYQNLWEYRFSRGGRIFVERRQGQRPQVVLIDPNHTYSSLAAF